MAGKSAGVFKMANQKCPRCKKGTMKYYHGWLGYESFQCDKCHYDVNDAIENKLKKKAGI